MRGPEIGGERDYRVETFDGFAVALASGMCQSKCVAYPNVVRREEPGMLQVREGLGVASLALVPVGTQVEEDRMQRSGRQRFARQRGRARKIRSLQGRVDVLEYGRFARLGHHSESPRRNAAP